MSRYPLLLAVLSPQTAHLFRVDETHIAALVSREEEKKHFSDHEGAFGATKGAPDVLEHVKDEHIKHHIREAAGLIAKAWSEDAYAHLVISLPERLKHICAKELAAALPGVSSKEVYGIYSRLDHDVIRGIIDRAFALPTE